MSGTRFSTSTIDYWREAIGSALEEIGDPPFPATSEQLDQMAEVLAQWADGKAQAFGEHCIPNPVDGQHKREIERLTRDRDFELQRLANQNDAFRKQIAADHGTEARLVTTDNNGNVVEIFR